jgi:predicted secreted acid phosphatase
MNNLIQNLTADILSDKRSICVFDLDSTLFNVSPRSEKILHEYAHESEQKKLLDLRISLSDWGVFEPLLKSGFSLDTHPELYQSLKKSWNQKFFSNEYLHFDTPYLGAVRFLQMLESNQINIQYLTGRDVFRMGQGTMAVLKKWGFPHHPQQIHLKPQKEMNDEQFKLEWMRQLLFKNPDAPIYLFENEPVNINLIGQNLPDIKMIYMGTTHSRQESVFVPHIEITSFINSQLNS